MDRQRKWRFGDTSCKIQSTKRSSKKGTGIGMLIWNKVPLSRKDVNKLDTYDSHDNKNTAQMKSSNLATSYDILLLYFVSNGSCIYYSFYSIFKYVKYVKLFLSTKIGLKAFWLSLAKNIRKDCIFYGRSAGTFRCSLEWMEGWKCYLGFWGLELFFFCH